MIVAEGTTLSELGEVVIPVKETRTLRLYLSGEPSVEAVEAFQDELIERGVPLTEEVAQDDRIVQVVFHNGEVLRVISAAFPRLGEELLGWQVITEEEKRTNILPWVLAGAVLLGMRRK